jgi:hypothetical protein
VDKQRQFILYTNAKFDPKRTGEVTNFTMIQDDRCDGNMFFNTSSGEGNVYRFEVNDKTPQDEKITKSDYENFFHDLDFLFVRKILKRLNKTRLKFCKTIYYTLFRNIWICSENGIKENLQIKKLTKRH